MQSRIKIIIGILLVCVSLGSCGNVFAEDKLADGKYRCSDASGKVDPEDTATKQSDGSYECSKTGNTVQDDDSDSGSTSSSSGSSSSGSSNSSSSSSDADADVSVAILTSCAASSNKLVCILEQGVNILNVIAGVLAVAGIVIVGIQYMTAGGNEAQLTKAKRRMLEIVIGALIYACLYAIVNWLLVLN